jgi:hypothetical protein
MQQQQLWQQLQQASRCWHPEALLEHLHTASTVLQVRLTHSNACSLLMTSMCLFDHRCRVLRLLTAVALWCSGGLMNIPDAYNHPLFNPDIDRATHFRTRNILCTAIQDMSGKNIAVVQVLLAGPFLFQHVRIL